jgi:hypothetical protein
MTGEQAMDRLLAATAADAVSFPLSSTMSKHCGRSVSAVSVLPRKKSREWTSELVQQGQLLISITPPVPHPHSLLTQCHQQQQLRLALLPLLLAGDLTRTPASSLQFLGQLGLLPVCSVLLCLPLDLCLVGIVVESSREEGVDARLRHDDEDADEAETLREAKWCAETARLRWRKGSGVRAVVHDQLRRASAVSLPLHWHCRVSQ